MAVRLHVKRPKCPADAYFVIPVRALAGMENHRGITLVAMDVVY